MSEGLVTADARNDFADGCILLVFKNTSVILGGGQKYGRLYVVLGGICWDGLVYGVGVERVRQRLVEKVRDFYSGPHVKDQKGEKKSLGQGSRNEALFIHIAWGYPSR